MPGDEENVAKIPDFKSVLSLKDLQGDIQVNGPGEKELAERKMIRRELTEKRNAALNPGQDCFYRVPFQEQEGSELGVIGAHCG